MASFQGRKVAWVTVDMKLMSGLLTLPLDCKMLFSSVLSHGYRANITIPVAKKGL
jgi:hypothetical protein